MPKGNFQSKFIICPQSIKHKSVSHVEEVSGENTLLSVHSIRSVIFRFPDMLNILKSRTPDVLLLENPSFSHIRCCYTR